MKYDKRERWRQPFVQNLAIWESSGRTAALGQIYDISTFLSSGSSSRLRIVLDYSRGRWYNIYVSQQYLISVKCEYISLILASTEADDRIKTQLHAAHNMI